MPAARLELALLAEPRGAAGLNAISPSPPDALPSRKLIEATVAQVFGVHTKELRRVSRGRAHVAQARQVAMYLSHVVLGLTMSQTGDLFRRDRTTVAHACSVVEDLRDDPVLDRVLELLEGVLPAILSPRDVTHSVWN